MKKKILLCLLAWYVMTTSGQKVAGPFSLLSDCQDVAKDMGKRFYNISSICRSFSD
jgi:hypothetical protein